MKPSEKEDYQVTGIVAYVFFLGLPKQQGYSNTHKIDQILRLWGKIRAPTILLHLCLSLKQVNKESVLIFWRTENYWKKTPHCSPEEQARTYAENPTLLITTSVKKINHTFQTRKITRVCDETEHVSWYTGDHCLSSLSFFLQRELPWQYYAVLRILQSNFQSWFELPMTTSLIYKKCFMRVANFDCAYFSNNILKNHKKPKQHKQNSKNPIKLSQGKYFLEQRTSVPF